ncbi:MAG: 23S rRNA (pseudouridine(1915)-N(3))-methyltransferase RlmH [Alphaproteobacteria bacterium]|nr:23S rRNA (pseudouridine(1915)-N(3))-methyltransferase RlmH [Alphaproteobacteria bacterium]
MKIRLLCVGRLKEGPERTLLDDYLARARKVGQSLGIKGLEEIEIEPGGGSDREGGRLLTRLSDAICVCLDEHGDPWPSKDLSRRLSRWRDEGHDVDFVIGGADGLAAAVMARARFRLGFGPQTWPHKLVRVMLAEQIYRALSIEAGSPYHRE